MIKNSMTDPVRGVHILDKSEPVIFPLLESERTPGRIWSQPLCGETVVDAVEDASELLCHRGICRLFPDYLFYGCLSFSLLWGVQAVFACFWSSLSLLVSWSVLSFLFSRFPPLVFSLVPPPQSCSLLPDYPDVLHLPLVSPPPLTCGFKPLHFHTEFASLLFWTSLICRFIAIFIHFLYIFYWPDYFYLFYNLFWPIFLFISILS